MNSTQWELNNFDTAICGFRVAKILHVASITTHPHIVSELIDDLTQSEIAYATYRFLASDIPLIHALESRGFRMVDGFLEMERHLKEFEYSDSTSQIQEATENDIAELTTLVRPLFTMTRFYNDPITRPFAGEIFAQWVTNSVRHEAADACFVWKEDGNIAGFITVKWDGHIPLVGVSPAYQGKNISRTLINYVFHILKKKGITSSKIETQIMNVPAIRSYQSCGFRIINSFVTFRWLASHP